MMGTRDSKSSPKKKRKNHMISTSKIVPNLIYTNIYISMIVCVRAWYTVNNLPVGGGGGRINVCVESPS